jgi:hypothetical protein
MTISVIGAGYGRTGTMSLKLALEQLGVGRCYHMVEVFQIPAAPEQWRLAADAPPGDWDTIFEGFSATVDWPGATFYREMAAHYPEAKVILTHRDPEAWFKSTQATIFANDLGGAEDTPFSRMAKAVVGRLFDQRLHDRDHVIDVYLRHNAEVQRVIPAERLLVYEVAEGWKPLCDFLGLPRPDGPMPKVNSTEEFVSRVGHLPKS